MDCIPLTSRDKEMLRTVLQKHLEDLKWEIAFTHSKDSTDLLEERREFMEGFMQRLGA